ncbi:hypothetical protein [Ramlibacter albus]|uniref:Uncharacterized protein n=1 Tax=Ramlibacter albus TaxID=2079448 RepID=A0A923MBV9_9BURK|nr:hypothetical protein [Ramlibacter albus]MBC5766539.1 hypothetical protein [Ramlibacter albus]
MPGPAKSRAPLSSHVPAVAAWVASMKGKPRTDEAGLVEYKLRHYWMRDGTDVEGRKALLAELEDLGRQFTSRHNATHPCFPAYFALGSNASKQLQAIDKAQSALRKARRIFVPSAHGSHGGETHHLVHRGAKGPVPTSEGNYWLECLDPKHRSWGHMDKAIFNRWLADTGTQLGFFEWCEEKGEATGVHSVRYLDPKERWKFMIVFGDDKIAYRHVPAPVDARGKGSIPLERFTTFDRKTAFNGKNYAIWVCSAGGIFYSDSHAVGEFHHSTFLAGGRVMGAGEWVVTAGKVLLVTHKTGHYMCSIPMFYNSLKLLAQCTDLSRTAVEVRDFTTSSFKFYRCAEFLHHGGNVAHCNEIRHSQTGAVLNMTELARAQCEMHRDWDGNWATSPRGIDSSGALRGMPASRPPAWQGA